MSTLVYATNFYDDMDKPRPQAKVDMAQLKRDAIAAVTRRFLDEAPGEDHRRILAAQDILLSDALHAAKNEVPYVKDGNDEWVIENDTCTCPDYDTAPHRVCAHRFAYRLYKRAQVWAKDHLTPQGQKPERASQGTEALFSVNGSDRIGTRFIQVTCRTDDPSVVETLVDMVDGILDRRKAKAEPEPARDWLDDDEDIPEPQTRAVAKKRFVEPSAKAAATDDDDDAPTCKFHRDRPMKQSKWNKKQWRCTKPVGTKEDGTVKYCDFELMEG